MPTSSTPPSRLDRLRSLVTARTWIFVAMAFVIGLLLFAVIWTKQRTQNDFFRVDDPQRSASGRALEPLPGPDTGRIATQAVQTDTPLPAPQPAGETSPAPATIEAPLADLAPLETFDATPPLSEGSDLPADGARLSGDSAPVPESTPSPRYPPAAMRRGDAGEVLLRVHVGPDGLTKQVDLVRGSGSGLLDRAATEAVRSWRFRPALRNGQPVDGTVQVPIRFSPGR